MSFILKNVDTVDSITREDFKKNYLDKRKPLIIKGLTNDWPAREKWSTDYFKEIAGDIEVKLVDNSKADPNKPINASIASMKFGEYLDLIKREPTELRIFFFNLFKHRPELVKDVKDYVKLINKNTPHDLNLLSLIRCLTLGSKSYLVPFNKYFGLICRRSMEDL